MFINKKLIIAGSILFSSFINGNVFAEDACEATVDIDQGKLVIPCLGLHDENGDLIEGSDTYTVIMDQRGNSANWEVSFVAEEPPVEEPVVEEPIVEEPVVEEPVVEEPIVEEPEVVECSSEIQLAQGTLYIPCLTLEDGNGSFSVFLEASQRGKSSNWKITLIKDNETGDIYDYRSNESEEVVVEVEEEEEEDDGCPNKNASQQAKDNHPECVY